MKPLKERDLQDFYRILQLLQIRKIPSSDSTQKRYFSKMAFKSPVRSGTLDNIPGISDDFRAMYRDLKRMESTTSIISDISEEEIPSNQNAVQNQSGELFERLEGVDIKDADAIWAKLSESERREMGQVAERHNMTAVLPTYNPWWENKVQRIQISEVGGDQCNVVSTEHEWRNLKHPKIKKTIADFSQVSPKSPAPHIKNNLANILAAYSSTVRFFYGEHLRSAYEAVKYLYVICSSLKSNEDFIDLKLAIEDVRKEARKEGLTIEDCDIQQIKRDVDSITEGPDPNRKTNCYVLAALSDLYRLFQLAKSRSAVTARKTSGSSSKTMEIVPSMEQVNECRQFINRFGDYKIVEFISMDKKQISSTLKQVEYFLAYTKKFLSYT